MKRIALLLALFCSLTTSAQTWQKVAGRWQYQFLKSDSTFTPPQDTLPGAPVGSLAVKNDVAYFKAVAGNWVSLVGLSVNIATTGLTATGNYTQHWAGKNLNFDSVGFLGLTGYGTYFGGAQRTGINFTPNSFSQTINISHNIRNVANNADSATHSIVFSAGGINLTTSATGTGKSASIVVGDNAAGQTVSIIASDSVSIGKAVAKATADSVFAVGPLQNSGKSNVLYKVPAIGLTGKNIANASLTATGDWNHNWANHSLYIDTLKAYQFKYYTDGVSGYAGRKRTGYYQFTGSTGHQWYDVVRNVANTNDSLNILVAIKPEYLNVQTASGFNNTSSFFVQNGLIQQQAIRGFKTTTLNVYTDSIVATTDSNLVNKNLNLRLRNLQTSGTPIANLAVTNAGDVIALPTAIGSAVNTGSKQDFTLNFVGTSSDSINALTVIGLDTATHINKDSTGVRLVRATNSTNIWDNRIIATPYGQTWTNTFLNTITIIPNFDPGTTRSIAIGQSVTGDNQIATSANYFGFALKLGADASSSGLQGVSSTSTYWNARFFTGLRWAKGDIIELKVEEKDRNKFYITATNLSNGSTVSGYLNFPLGSTANVNWYTIDPGYPSIFFNGGDFTVTKYSFDPLASGVQLVWLSNSIGYGYSLDNAGINNNFYTYYNIIKNQIPVKSVLMAKSGTTTLDLQHAMREVLLYKPKYAVIDGIQTNDYFAYGFGSDTITTRTNYTSIVDKLKANGINVIHIVPMPRGTNDALYKKFQLYQKNWILRTFPNDIIVNDFNALLAPDSLNTLNPAYYMYGDGTHPNVAGHAIRANAFLNTVQFDYYKGSVRRTNTDTLVTNIATIGTGAAPSNAFALEVNGAVKADSIIGGTTASDSIYFTTTRNATKGKFLFGQNFQIHEASGFTGIGNFTTAQNAFTQLHVRNKSSSTVEIRVENDSTKNGAAARFGLVNDVGDLAQVYLGSSINAFTPRVLNINNGQGVGISSTNGNIMFGNNAIFISPWSNVTAAMTPAGNFGIGPALVAPTDRLHVLGTAKITDTLKLPNIINKGLDTTNFKPVVVDGNGNVFKNYWLSGSTSLQRFSQTADVVVSGTSTETTLIGTGVGSLTIPANYLTAGKSYRVTLRGKYSTDPTNPAQMNWKVKVGGTVISASGNAGLGTNKTDKGYEVHCDFTCRTTGSSGTVMAQGMFFTEDGPGAKNMTNSFSTTTINTTVSNAVDVTVTLSDGSAGNSCFAYILIFEEI